jgi:plasmid maintenance system antidote protein VapI
MADSSVIKEFLVALGFTVSEAGLKKFGDGIATAGKQTVAFAATVVAAQVAVNAFVVEAAENFEKLYYASQRAGTSAENLKALQYGFSQIGLGADAATQTLESFALALKMNPAQEGFLRSLGIATRDAPGKMRDTAAIVTDFAKKLSSMPPWLAGQMAQMFGISAQQLFQMQRYARELEKAQQDSRTTAKAFGVDLDEYGLKSHEFMVGLRQLGNDVDMIWAKVSGELIKNLLPTLDKFHDFLLAHGKEISEFGVGLAGNLGHVAETLALLFWGMEQIVDKTVGWENALKAVAAVILYRIFGPISAVIAVIDYFRGQFEDIEKKDKKRVEEGHSDEFYYNDRGEIIGRKGATDGKIGEFFEHLKQKWDEFFGTESGIQRESFRPAGGGNGIIPASYSSSREVVGSLADRGKTVMDALIKGLGLTPAQAAGIASNLAAESGISPINEAHPLIPGSRGGFGIAQWTGSRRNDFERWCAENGMNPTSLDANVQFLMYELKNKYGGVLNNVMRSQTARDAARAFFPFESGGSPFLQHHEGDHSAFADKLLENYTLGQGGSGGRGNINMNQKTDIHVHGSDPKTTADEVAVRQRGVNADVIRNLNPVGVYA